MSPQWSQPEIDRAFYAIVTDHLGTPTHLIDPAAAAVTAHATTTLWGQSTWTGSVSTPLRFPGQYLDPETGWHYNRYRYYQPHTGRYSTPDPLGLAPASNLHTYPSNPTTHIDPLGLAPTDACEGRASEGDSQVKPVNGRLPITSQYAGRQFPLEQLDPALAAKYPAGVRFTEQGFPDFSPYSVYEVTLDSLGPPEPQILMPLEPRWEYHHSREDGYGITSRIRPNCN